MLRMLAIAGGAAAILSRDAEPLRQTCEPIRAMTYNILVSADLASEGKYRWSVRREALIGQLQAARPAILGLQEVSRVQKADLRRNLPGYKFESIPGETSVLAIDGRVFRTRSNGSFWLSPRPFSRSKGWDAAYTRTVNWSHLVRRSDRRTFLVLNTHLDNRGRQARVESARQIVAWINAHRQPGEAVVLVGDFNSLPNGNPSNELTSSSIGFREARAITRSPPVGPDGTLNGFVASPAKSIRVDFIFVDPTLEVGSYTVLAPSDPAAAVPSDHFPVIADIDACSH